MGFWAVLGSMHTLGLVSIPSRALLSNCYLEGFFGLAHLPVSHNT